MTDHYHLLVETPHGGLSRGMQYLNGVYTERFNRRHGRVGHLFQGRFTAILVKKESHLLEVARYVVLNPVRAGMVRDPGDWRWSSYRATAGLAPVPPFLTVDWIRARFGDDPATAGRADQRFVDAGRGAKVWNDLRGGWLLGSSRFADAVRPLLEATRWTGSPPAPAGGGPPKPGRSLCRRAQRGGARRADLRSGAAPRLRPPRGGRAGGACLPRGEHHRQACGGAEAGGRGAWGGEVPVLPAPPVDPRRDRKG